jgi:hypothetical protein
VGIAPDKFLNAESDIELQCLVLVAEKAIEYRTIEQRNQAILIIQYLGKALGADKKKQSGV